MARKIINIGVETDPLSGDPIRVASDKINENFTECYNNIAALLNTVHGNAPCAERWTVPRVLLLQDDVTGSVLFDGSANVLLKTTVTASSASIANRIVRRDADGGFSAGDVTMTGTGVSRSGISERFRADALYDAGTVVIYGGSEEITTTDRPNDIRVSGVVANLPGVILGAARGSDATHPAVILFGRASCKVIGPITKGDMLVTSDKPGFAKAAEAGTRGAILGKALADFGGRQGMIDIIVAPR